MTKSNGKINDQTFQLLMKELGNLRDGQDQLWRKVGNLEKKIDDLAESAAFQKGKLYVIASLIGLGAALLVEWIKQKLFN